MEITAILRKILDIKEFTKEKRHEIQGTVFLFSSVGMFVWM